MLKRKVINHLSARKKKKLRISHGNTISYERDCCRSPVFGSPLATVCTSSDGVIPNGQVPLTSTPSPSSPPSRGNLNGQVPQASTPSSSSLPSRGNLDLDKTEFDSFSNLDLDVIEEQAASVATQSGSFLDTACDDDPKRFEDSQDDFFGLSLHFKHFFLSQKSISALYTWQQECLNLKAVKERKNLIYSLPTSGGKTLVAEILMLQTIMCLGMNVLFVLPFVSIVQEKVRSLTPFALEFGFCLEEYAGGKGVLPPLNRRNKKSLFIATIEKAHSLINCFIEQRLLSGLGLVVVDELHMIGESGSRGSILEILLTKIRRVAVGVQIIGMSATLGNLGELRDFLNAELYTSRFRPVRLTQYVKLDKAIFEVLPPDGELKHCRDVSFNYSKEMTKKDPDHLLGLVCEVLPNNSCLVFCSTKRNCQAVAILVCRHLQKKHKENKKEERKELLVQLSMTADPLCSVLKQCIPFGVAYHHSGLTSDERKLIEESFLNGVLWLITSTSTLAAGVNLPASRVIIRSPYVGNKPLSKTQYMQMSGRAGRACFNRPGESYLIVKDPLIVPGLVSSVPQSCHSRLLDESRHGLKMLILDIIAMKLAITMELIIKFLTSTLLACQTSSNLPEEACGALEELLKLGLVSRVSKLGHVTLGMTKIGEATFKGGVKVAYADRLYKDLVSASKQLVVSTNLHLLYLVTPYDSTQSCSVDWFVFLNEFYKLSPDEANAASLIGIKESILTSRAIGKSLRNQFCDQEVYRRFFLALALNLLVNETPVTAVGSKFNLTRGFIQQLSTAAASFCYSVSRYCDHLPELWALSPLLTTFYKSLSYCCRQELVPLMEISGVKLARAKQLFNSGYKTLQLVASAQADTMAATVDHLPRGVARAIIQGAKMLIRDKATDLKDQAEELLETDIVSVQELIVDWKNAVSALD